jgi:hypothetical protein
MSASIHGWLRTWSGTRNDEGQRQFLVTHIVKTTSADDGPQTVMFTPGLPQVGSFYNFGNDTDVWAFCSPNMKVSIHKEKEGDPAFYWRVDQVFTTIPFERCQDEAIEDPLLEPQKIGGSFVKYTEEAAKDKDGVIIDSSSHELFRGPQVEFDKNRPTVWVEQNKASLGLATFAAMVDTLNNAALWGLSARKIKLSNVSWERKLYGLCNFYYTRRFEFDVNDSALGFDREVLDEGTKVLNGHWPAGTGSTEGWILDNIAGTAPDKTNPQHFIRYYDRPGNIARVILDGNGEPLGTADPVFFTLRKYTESNFLLLGIPTTL